MRSPEDHVLPLVELWRGVDPERIEQGQRSLHGSHDRLNPQDNLC